MIQAPLANDEAPTGTATLHAPLARDTFTSVVSFEDSVRLGLADTSVYTPSSSTAYVSTEADAPSDDKLNPSVSEKLPGTASVTLVPIDIEVALGWNRNDRSITTCAASDETLNARLTPPNDSAAMPTPTPCTMRVACE